MLRKTRACVVLCGMGSCRFTNSWGLPRWRRHQRRLSSVMPSSPIKFEYSKSSLHCAKAHHKALRRFFMYRRTTGYYFDVVSCFHSNYIFQRDRVASVPAEKRSRVSQRKFYYRNVSCEKLSLSLLL